MLREVATIGGLWFTQHSKTAKLCRRKPVVAWGRGESLTTNVFRTLAGIRDVVGGGTLLYLDCVCYTSRIIHSKGEFY